MLITRPTAFARRPEILPLRVRTLQQHLGLDAAAALQVAITHPTLLDSKLEARLPPLLHFLDGYMGEGAGRRLALAQPSLAILTAKAAERSVGSLAARGYSQQKYNTRNSQQAARYAGIEPGQPIAAAEAGLD